MAKEFKLTSIRLAELEQELHYLKTTRELEVAEHLKEARSFEPVIIRDSPLVTRHTR